MCSVRISCIVLWCVISIYKIITTNNLIYKCRMINVKVAFDGNPAAISSPFWTQWNVNLGAVGTDLGRVNSLTIGVEGAGARGALYVDDIRLYGQAPEPVVP